MVREVTGFTSPRVDQKVTLDFVVKFFLLLVQHCIHPKNVGNVLTWDRAVFVEAMVEGLEIDYARVVITMIHERGFKTSTTYPIACLIFQLSRESGVIICYYDTLRSPMGTVDIGITKDEANIETPQRGSRIEMPPLSENLADTVELAQGAYPATSALADTTLADSTHFASRASCFSRSTPHLAALVPLAQV